MAPDATEATLDPRPDHPQTGHDAGAAITIATVDEHIRSAHRGIGA